MKSFKADPVKAWVNVMVIVFSQDLKQNVNSFSNRKRGFILPSLASASRFVASLV